MEHSPDRQGRLTELKGVQAGLAPWDLARCNNCMDFFSSFGNYSGAIGTPENLMFSKYLLHREEETKVTQGRDGDGLPHMTTEAVLSTLCLCLLLSLSTFTALPIHSQQKAQMAPELPLPRKHYRYPSEPQVIQASVEKDPPLLPKVSSACRGLASVLSQAAIFCQGCSSRKEWKDSKEPFLEQMSRLRFLQEVSCS